MPERITLVTADQYEIMADWMPAPTMIGAAVLIHMMPETRRSWTSVQQALMKHGVASLAIDLRGHGESNLTPEGDPLDYHQFEESDHGMYVLDVEAAVDWLQKRGIEMNRIVMCGASIGANVALRELTNEPRMPGAVLLSPGADYHGFRGIDDIEDVLPEQQIVIVTSENDQQSFESSQKMFGMASSEGKQFIPYKTAGHGTAMLGSDPALAEKIAGWCASFIKG